LQSIGRSNKSLLQSSVLQKSAVETDKRSANGES